MSKKNLRILYSSLAFITLLAGLSLVFVFKGNSWLRGNISDFLVVIFIFALLKLVWPRLSSLKGGIMVFSFASLVEGLQYLRLPQLLGKQNLLLELTLGSTFDWLDIAYYFLGTALISCFDYLLQRD